MQSKIVTAELKSDLESIYKVTGDLLNLLETSNLDSEKNETMEIIDLVKFRLRDIGGTLQKDIFHCGNLVTKDYMEEQGVMTYM